MHYLITKSSPYLMVPSDVRYILEDLIAHYFHSSFVATGMTKFTKITFNTNFSIVCCRKWIFQHATACMLKCHCCTFRQTIKQLSRPSTGTEISILYLAKKAVQFLTHSLKMAASSRIHTCPWTVLIMQPL